MKLGHPKLAQGLIRLGALTEIGGQMRGRLLYEFQPYLGLFAD